MIIGKCTSCGNNVVSETTYAKFKCPSCLEVVILRCENCKSHGNTYICERCGFEGP